MKPLLFFSKTENKDLGVVLSNLPPLFFQNLNLTSVYYLDGNQELDDTFGNEKYFTKGFYSFLSTTDKTFQIVFKNENGSNEIGLIISRNDIIEFKQIDNQNLDVTYLPATKNTIANTLKAQGGLIGGIAGAIIKRKILSKTALESCNVFKLKYFSKNDKIEEITLYVQKKFYQEVFVFINTYFKKELSEKAKIPKKDPSCFIATATYKDIYSKEVVYFREYRDNVLLKSNYGNLLVKIYYRISPNISKIVFKYSILNKSIKYILDEIYKRGKNK